MFQSRSARPGWAGTIVLIGIVAGAASQAAAQERPTALPSPDRTLPPDGTSVLLEQAFHLDGEAVPDKAAPSPWANVPPPYPWPPLGWAFRRPTGPGYYSLWDMVTNNYRDKPPPYPWPPFGLDIVPMFDANFHYLDNPDNTEHDPIFDWTKRLHIGDNWMFSTGGEERVRYDNEVDSRVSGKDNNYDLERIRIYGDLWYKDQFRVYIEFMDAEAFNYALPPLGIDRDRDDLVNAFVDVKLLEVGQDNVYLRVGRQELIYGSERLITSKDWANVLQTFQGVKEWYRSEKLDLDAFYVQPVIPNAEHFASVDDKQGFAGLWATYRPKKDDTLDFYVLNLENSNPVTQTFLAEPGGRGGYNVTTIGARSYSVQDYGLLWDFEGMYQFGEFTNESISADAWVAGLGWEFKDLPTHPSFWVYDEFASGSHHPGQGTDGTFNQLFPYAHYYLGWLDEVGRQNINDFNMELQLYPLNWVTVLLQYHVFRLDSATDALYNVGGGVERRDPTGKAGTDVGDELDLVVSFHLDAHQDVLFGYSKLYAGDFLKRTGPGGSPETFYAQYSLRW